MKLYAAFGVHFAGNRNIPDIMKTSTFAALQYYSIIINQKWKINI